MKIRKATPADASQLAELRKKQLSDEGFAPEAKIDEELEAFFITGLQDETFISFVAEKNQTIIATSGLCFYQLPPSFSNPSGKCAYVTNMYTRDEYRGEGLASQLLDLIIGEATTQGYRVIRLHASLQGKSIYSKKGFRDSGGYMTLKL